MSLMFHNVPRKVVINGVKLQSIDASDEDIEDFIAKLEFSGYEIQDLDGWKSKAKEYSEQTPFIVEQFAERVYGAAAICIKQFYLKHFEILIKCPATNKKLLNPILCSLNGRQSRIMLDTWHKAERGWTYYYEEPYETKEGRDEMIESVKNMAETIEQIDVNVVRSELNSAENVKYREVQKEICKIGNDSYEYNRLAY